MELGRRNYWNIGVFLIAVLICIDNVISAEKGENATVDETTSTVRPSTTAASEPKTTAEKSTTRVSTASPTNSSSILTTSSTSPTTSSTSSTSTSTSTTTTIPLSNSASSSTESLSTSQSRTEPSSSTTRRTSPAEESTIATATVSSTTGYVAAGQTADSKAIIIGVVVGVGGALLLVLIVLLAIFCCRRYGTCCYRKAKTVPGGAPFGPSHVLTIVPYLPDKPVQQADFLDHVTHHQANISAYKAEFESLPAGNKVGKSTTTANDPANRNLNRYINILPYNDTLVPLSNGELKRYINASFIEGYRDEKAYIASQAPLPGTLGDFWEMVWEHDCGKIVMVTNLFERGQAKCDKYWPIVNETENYGTIRVDAIAERSYGDYILRTFRIRKQSASKSTKDKARGTRRPKAEEQDELRETRLVYQFHFTTWPDQGVPNTCTALLKLYRHSIKEPLPECRPGPVVIHCSAGVGRTGTLIALDLCLARAKDKATIDIPRCIDKMRRQRMFMVQTVEQYIFIHHVLLEALILDEVEIPCAKFLSAYQQLVEPTPPDGQSRIQREFKVLEVLKPQFSGSMFSAAQQYPTKNRTSTILPADSFIPYIPNEDETHIYINAVHVFGHPKRALDDDEVEEGSQYSFIATQSPTANTIEDFWSMIRETGSSTIVMLNELDGVERYWPEDGRTLNFGQFSVTNMGEIASEDIRMTDLQIAVTKKSKPGSSSPPADESLYANAPGQESVYANSEPQAARSEMETFNIRHFRLLTWPDSLPRESTLISLYGEVIRCRERNPNRPVVVHCLYGAERCGVFCGVMSVLDTIKMDCEVDVFNAVKRIRRTRPEFIPDLAQYKFLYDVAMEQIKSQDKVDYPNGRLGTLLLGSSS